MKIIKFLDANPQGWSPSFSSQVKGVEKKKNVAQVISAENMHHFSVI